MFENNGVFLKIKESISNRDSLLGQFARYFVTGGLASIADFGVFAVVLYHFEVHYLMSNLIGLMAGNVVNYVLSIGWVFRSQKRKMENNRILEIFVFVLISLVGLALNETLMYLGVGVLGVQEMISKIFAAAIVLMWNFIARKLILFHSKKDV